MTLYRNITRRDSKITDTTDGNFRALSIGVMNESIYNEPSRVHGHDLILANKVHDRHQVLPNTIIRNHNMVSG